MTASHTCSDRRPYIVLTSARLEQAMKDERDKFEGVTTMVNYYVKAQKQLAEEVAAKTGRVEGQVTADIRLVGRMEDVALQPGGEH